MFWFKLNKITYHIKGRLFQAQVRVNHEVNSGNFPS